MSSNLGGNLTLAGASVLLSLALAEVARRVYAIRLHDRRQTVNDEPTSEAIGAAVERSEREP